MDGLRRQLLKLYGGSVAKVEKIIALKRKAGLWKRDRELPDDEEEDLYYVEIDHAKVDSDIVKNIQTLQLEGSVENAKEGMALATSMQEDLVMDGQCLKP